MQSPIAGCDIELGTFPRDRRGATGKSDMLEVPLAILRPLLLVRQETFNFLHQGHDLAPGLFDGVA